MDVTKLSGLQYKILEMAGRIRDLREISRFTPEEMAQKTGTTTEEYLLCEEGKSDLNFAFLYRCASAFGVDVTDIIEGESPKLSTYTLTRFGEGQKIEQAHEMIYYNMAAGFKNRIADPLYVINKYSDEAFNSPIELTTHVGQEFDLVIRGSLKVQVGDHTEILYEGDSIYYDSGIPHGMVAASTPNSSLSSTRTDANHPGDKDGRADRGVLRAHPGDGAEAPDSAGGGVRRARHAGHQVHRHCR